MRVVAGTARGRKLIAPKGLAVRPTSDRVREAVFNSLHSLDAIVDKRVVDLFAGTGALGIEALSRGAAHATFVDDDPTAIKIIGLNLDATGLRDNATIVRQDALAFARRSDSTDLVIADPPYAFAAWDDLLSAIQAEVIVLESDRALAVPTTYRVLKEKAYGSTVVTVARFLGNAS